jgi:hypothetical protein
MTEKEFVGLLRPVVEAWQELKEQVEKPDLTIESVYGKVVPAPQPGWRFKREIWRTAPGLISNIVDPVFRIPLPGEHWMRPDGTVSECTGGMSEPRLILVKCKRLVFYIIGEDRHPRKGELFSSGTTVTRACDEGHCQLKYILSEPRVEE